MLFAVLLAACTPDPAKGPADSDSGVSEAPTWYADVAPLTEQYCVRCHADGGSAPFSLEDPATAQAMASAMLAAIDAGQMPPPAADPTCRDYEGSENLVLPAGARDTIAAWVDAGAPLGDPATAVHAEPVVTTLDRVDLEVRMPTPYTPTFTDAANPGNEYRCFYIDPGISEDVFITGLEPIVDTPELIHHIVLFTVPESDVPAGYDEARGEDCIDGAVANPTGMIAAWAPGMLPVTFPEGVGLRVPTGTRLVMQIHYYQSAAATEGMSDQSGYAFELAPSVTSEASMYPLGNSDFTIPAGDDSYSAETTLAIPDWVPVTGTIYSIFPHMHLLGKGYHVWIERDGVDTCMVQSDDYSFHNQLTYQFRETQDLRAGDIVHLECTWDNSSTNPDQPHTPPTDVSYGERTDEEMCFGFTFMSLNY
jgi:hypothetical protein